MNHNIQNLTKTKTTLICLSTGKYEKRYLEKMLKNKNKCCEILFDILQQNKYNKVSF